jgi:CTP synthase
MHKPKFIVVTGGVLSGLGKGIATASIGNLISDKLKVVPIKCDGYLNADPGTMNPVEHGEVFVLDDGGEVDMDFGHYERFLNITCKKKWNLTMGKVFKRIMEKERRGDFLGKTVQFIPHVTDTIKEWFFEVAQEENADILLIEVGGTIGDIESELYVEAVRQLQYVVGKENMMYVHLTYVPIPGGVNEQKSKPTQQSVNLLQQKGIHPDMIIGRCETLLEPHIKEKIATFCGVEKEAVISGMDVPDVYNIPILYEQEGVAELVHKKLNIYSPPNLGIWKKLIQNGEQTKQSVTIAVCGKYTKLEDSYASIIEALKHCGAHLQRKVEVKWVETSDKVYDLTGVEGVIVPGGFGTRGVEGKINAIQHCREQHIPFLGICYGLQMAVVEFARNKCNLEGAHTTEVNAATEHPVITLLPGQDTIKDMGGTLRLGAYEARVQEGSKVHAVYDNSTHVYERHRHRYEVNPSYHQHLQEAGMLISGLSPDGRLAEFIELPNHPYFLATQGHPELKSTLLNPAPLFMGLVKAAIEKKEKKQTSLDAPQSVLSSQLPIQ